MKTTYNGCSYTEIWASPSNWKTTTSKALLQKQWYIQCNFFDPAFSDKYPKGFQFRKKVNGLKTLAERKLAIEYLIKEIRIMLEDQGYNPVTKQYMVARTPEPPEETGANLGPATGFVLALHLAHKQLRLEKSTSDDIRQILVHISSSARQLHLEHTPVQDIRRKHIKKIISNLELQQGEFSGHKFNKYRTALQILYNELVEDEAVEYNILRDLRKRTAIKVPREVMTMAQRKAVKKYLSAFHPEFYRFTEIFFHSSSRETELMRLKVKDVDLANQTYRVLIRKGRYPVWVDKVIKDIALPFWKDVLQTGEPDDYVFSKGLVPGPNKIRTDQINKRWKRSVKDPLNITADFYSLKHSNSDEISEKLSLQDAASAAGHKDVSMMEKVYAVGESARQNERLRKIRNEFG